MNGVERYNPGGLAKAKAAVTLATTGVVCLGRSYDFINYIVNHGLSIRVYLYLVVVVVLLLLPAIHLVVAVPGLFCGWLLFDQDRHAPRPPRRLPWARRLPAAEAR